jgi:hypothetical protein
VDRIASVHGRTATKEEFDRAVKLPDTRVVYDRRSPQNTVFWGKDSSPFMEEVMEWLLKKR